MFIKIPDVSFSKSKISDIGFQTDDGISLYATLSEDTEKAQWVKISEGDNINRTVNVLKAVSSSDNQKLILRVIMC